MAGDDIVDAEWEEVPGNKGALRSRAPQGGGQRSSHQQSQNRSQARPGYYQQPAFDKTPILDPEFIRGIGRLFKRVLMVLGIVFVVLFVILMTAGSPDNDQQTTAEPQASATPTTTATDGNAVPPKSDLISGCYHLDSCAMYQLLNKKTVRRRDGQQLVQASLLEGQIPNASNESPDLDLRQVVWDSKPTTFFALCSIKTPAIAFKAERGWLAERLDFASGIPGVKQNAASMYVALCLNGHQPDEQEAVSLGYTPMMEDEADQFSIDSPFDLLPIAASKESEQPSQHAVAAPLEAQSEAELGVEVLEQNQMRLEEREAR